ncbi:hypothetical protein PQR62_24120 [Herbaspirillum lusitanum]|uniref:DUF2946 domain-containing protein n=1 Tax=Herbaspirillum lusitanum TaxID=213312 RepID=A0ABW9AGD9_9BURK
MHSLRRIRSLAVTATLVIALLFAQMLGLAHSIVHAGWAPGAVHSLLDESLFDYGESNDAHELEAPAAAAAVAVTGSADAASDPAAAHASAHDGDHHHSCVAYDAATLAASVHIDFPLPPLMPGTHVLALWQAFASWDAPFVCHFFSRAPPR